MTQDKDMPPATLSGLEHILDVYGADRSRWPPRERLRFSAFVADNANAKRLINEAAALNTLLDRAPSPAVGDLTGLTERIVAASGAPLASRSSAVTPLRPRVKAPVPRADDGSWGWPAAALLAASLVLGVFAGTSGYVEAPMLTIASITSGSGESDEDAAQFVQAPYDLSGIEEDLL